jgi:hypothetical protein
MESVTKTDASDARVRVFNFSVSLPDVRSLIYSEKIISQIYDLYNMKIVLSVCFKTNDSIRSLSMY